MSANTPGMGRPRAAGYVELHCHSAFSLLDGASLPEALVTRAAALGYPALALTDHDDLGGIVRFSTAAKEAGIGGIVGVELTVGGSDSERREPSAESSLHAPSHLVLLAQSPAGYANLSTLVTRARMDRPRGEPGVSLETVAEHADGLFALTGCMRGWVPSLLARGDVAGARRAAGTLADIFGGRVAVECWDHHLDEERALVAELIPLSRALDLPWVVTNNVHYAEPPGRIVHDVLTALRHQRPLDAMGTRLRPSAEWCLKSARQLRHRWRGDDAGLRATVAIAEQCTFRLDHLTPSLPTFPLPPGVTEDEYLERLVAIGAEERWGERRAASAESRSLHARQRRQLRHELSIIRQLELAGYFLIVWDIVRFARREGILCQGRGSAANSAVCYCLGITAVDPVKMELLFERFLSEDRQEAPDIDLDIAHRDRERVIQYVYERYGRDHAAMVCEQITYRSRSAVRDAARVLGFSVEQSAALSMLSDRFSAKATAEALRERGAESVERGGSASSVERRASSPLPFSESEVPSAESSLPAPRSPLHDSPSLVAERLGQNMVRGTEATTRAREVKAEARRDAMSPDVRPAQKSGASSTLESSRSTLVSAGLDPRDRRVRALADVVEGLHQIPRHRSIHVGGFVLTREPLFTVVPIEPASMADRTVIQWEKDDLDPVGLVKIDLLGLGMLTVLQDCLKYIRQTRGVNVDLAQLEMNDQAVYDMICAADTIGVFQVESRAQMNTLPRLKPRCFYDLVVEVAIIRPGPIQGDMVHPYLRRRAGEEEVTYPHPSLEPILKRTLGIPLFQEQGMQVAITAAGFTPGEADQLRRAMGHKRSRERMAEICERLVVGMEKNGIPKETALKIYNQINAFADYGFPESHAASFALIVYASAYLKHYYAPEFTAAMLNAQPMGFYAPGTLIEDARRHGVKVLPVDASRSGFDCTLEVERGAASVERGAPSTLDARRSTLQQPRAESRSFAAPPSLRLGLRLVRGLGSVARARLEQTIAEGGPFRSIGDVVQRSGLDRRALRLLAEAGAFDAFVPDEPQARRRRSAVWRLLETWRGDAGPLAPMPVSLQVPIQVPAMSPFEMTESDYRVTGVSLNGHPMRHLRPVLEPNGITRACDAQSVKDGMPIAVAGLVICRQRPGTAKGFVFLTLEDETGLVNVVVTPQRFERHALLISTSPLLLVRGVLQIEQKVVNVRGRQFRALEAPVGAEHAKGHNFR